MMRWTILSCVVVASASCQTPECAFPDYSRAECRVIAENELARLVTADGVEVRFQEANAQSDETWSASGLLASADDGTIVARVAGPGDFAISLRRPAGEVSSSALRLDNVDPRAEVVIEQGAVTTRIPAVPQPSRTLDLSWPAAGQLAWIRGRTACPERFTLAFTADIQTNPTQFRRIVERLAQDVDAEAPLLGLVVAGDISENTRQEELDLVAQILRDLPVPVAVTAGNHDVYRPTRPYYNLSFGPGNHVRSICGVRLVLLDTGSGAIASSVEARLPDLLDRGDDRWLVTVMHHPVYPGVLGNGWSSEAAADRMLTELGLAAADLVVAGHAHSLQDFGAVPVGDTHLRELIVGTAGAYQGLGDPRFGYVRLTVDEGGLSTCFVEVPPPGYDGATSEAISDDLPYCP
jgi:hypothetical protein